MEVGALKTVFASTIISKMSDLNPRTLAICLGTYTSSDVKVCNLNHYSLIFSSKITQYTKLQKTIWNLPYIKIYKEKTLNEFVIKYILMHWF